MGGQRDSINTPHPIYGIAAGGFSVGDLPPSYSSGSEIVFLTAVTGNQISAAKQTNANMGLQVNAVFSDAATSCTLTVLRADPGGDTVLATFQDVNNLSSDLYVGWFDQRVEINAVPVKVQISNYTGTGTITVTGVRTN